jgi:hypothetical protein
MPLSSMPSCTMSRHPIDLIRSGNFVHFKVVYCLKEKLSNFLLKLGTFLENNC